MQIKFNLNFISYVLCLASPFLIAQEIQQPEASPSVVSFPCQAPSSKIDNRLYNIDLMHNVLRQGEYRGYDVIIISSTTQEEADYQQEILDRAFAGTSRVDGRSPIILSVVDTTEGGQLIGSIFTWLKAEEKMRDRYANLMASYPSFLDYVRTTRSRVAVYHNGGKGERCSPLTQSLGNSRGAQKLVGSVRNALGEEIELEVLLAVVLQCSSFATTNQGTHFDTYWTSQIAFGSYPHDQLVRSNFAIDKFLVGFNKDDLIAQNLADFGTAALSQKGQMVAFYGNKRFAFRKGDQYLVDHAKIEAELLSKGDRFAYDFGSFSCSFEMWQCIVDYWLKKDSIADSFLKGKRSTFKRDIDPHFIQPLIRLLYGIHVLADRYFFDQMLPSPTLLKTQEDLDAARENLDCMLRQFLPHIHAYIWADITHETKKREEAAGYINEVLDFYLLYRQMSPFIDLGRVFGFIDLGDDTQWFRYRRPIDIMNEKFEMLTDLMGYKMEAQLNGTIHHFEADSFLTQRCCEARLMRGIKEQDMVNFKVEGKPVTLSFQEIQAGKKVEGVYVKNSIIQNSDLTRGSSVINSIVNNVCGKIIVKNAYLESSTAPFIEAYTSIVHEVIDTQQVKADREVVSDVYRTFLSPFYHGRMRAPIGYDPKGMSIYKIVGKGEKGLPIYHDELDETIRYFIERVPYDLKDTKEYSDETARTEDGCFTFEEIRRIQPLRMADKCFRESLQSAAQSAVFNSRVLSQKPLSN